MFHACMRHSRLSNRDSILIGILKSDIYIYIYDLATLFGSINTNYNILLKFSNELSFKLQAHVDFYKD